MAPTPRRLMLNPGGGFPVPGAMTAEQFPPAVRESIARIFAGPPKPAVTLPVMNEAQQTMLAPDLPFRGNV